jgi:diguanylate cyclase (GGDEF)-like protein
MAAIDSQHSQNQTRAAQASRDPLAAPQLAARLEEEVARAERHHTALSCLLVGLDDVEQLARAHGAELPAQALAYFAAALAPELRRFDRVGRPGEGELLVVLPGADERRGEIVARRALGRLHAIKLDVQGHRLPLRVSMGIAAWHDGLSAEQLLSLTRLAAQRGDTAREGPVEPAQQPLGAGEVQPVRRS